MGRSETSPANLDGRRMATACAAIGGRPLDLTKVFNNHRVVDINWVKLTPPSTAGLWTQARQCYDAFYSLALEEPIPIPMTTPSTPGLRWDLLGMMQWKSVTLSGVTQLTKVINLAHAGS